MKKGKTVVDARQWRTEKKARKQTALYPAPHRGAGISALQWADSNASAHTYVRTKDGAALLAALRKFIVKGGNPWAVLQNSSQFMSAKDRALWAKSGVGRPVVGCFYADWGGSPQYVY